MKILSPKIYVACLAAYNNGYIHGVWVDANQDVDLLFEEINKMLAESPIKDSEEFAIHDYEDFGSVYISEYSGLEQISKIAALLAEYGEIGAEVLSQRGGSVEESQQLLEEGYHGEFDSEEDFTYYWTHEVDCIEIPDRLQYYIDYKSMARDLFMTDFLSVQIGQKVHVFSNC